MPRYLALCKYSQDSIIGLSKESPTAREQFVRSMYEANGGRVESFNWTLGGEYTIAMIIECDRDVGMAITTAVLGSGALSEARAFELMTSAEMDKAIKTKVAYRPPGT